MIIFYVEVHEVGLIKSKLKGPKTTAKPLTVNNQEMTTPYVNTICRSHFTLRKDL